MGWAHEFRICEERPLECYVMAVDAPDVGQEHIFCAGNLCSAPPVKGCHIPLTAVRAIQSRKQLPSRLKKVTVLY